MIELSKELTDCVKEAAKDAAWMERLGAAATWEGYAALLGEKGIEATAELKEAFEEAHPCSLGALGDDELEKVAGGFGPLLPCWQKYNLILCEAGQCPHVKDLPYVPDRYHGDVFCDLGYWRQNRELTKPLK